MPAVLTAGGDRLQRSWGDILECGEGGGANIELEEVHDENHRLPRGAIDSGALE